MKLVNVYFRSGVNVSFSGTKHPALSSWSLEKHGAEISCEEQKNGDVWLTTKDGRRRVIRPWAVDWCMYEPEAQIKAVAR